jgi:hypothetical protein
MKRFFFGLIAALFAAESAQAALIDSYGPTSTNWSHVFTLDGFNTLGGTRALTSAQLTFTGDIYSVIRVESLDAAPATVTATAQGQVTFSNIPNSAPNVILLPLLSSSTGLSAYDGTIDWGGTSGYNFGSLHATDSGSKTFTLPADLSFFNDKASFNLSAANAAFSGASGAGNLITWITTTGAASVSIAYNWAPVTPVPVPATTALLCLGLVGMIGLRRQA